MRTHASGQARTLQGHDKWIIGFGITEKSGVIHSKLLANNLTSGDIAHLMLPTHNVVQNNGRGAVIEAQKLFPGYFLLGVTNDQPIWWEMQSGVEEIFSILTSVSGMNGGRVAAFLRENEKEHIVDMIKEIPYHAGTAKFDVGDRVVVTEGSFKNLCGKITEMRTKTAKVEIEVRSKIIPTVFSLFDLEPQRKKNS